MHEIMHFYAKADLMPYVGTKTAKTLAAQAKGPRGQERKQGDIFCPLESIYQKHIKIDGITLTACIYDAHCALIGFEYYEYCSFASHTYPICVHNARRKTGAGFLPNTRFSALNPVFSHFLKIAVFFIFWPVPKPSAPCKFLPPRPYLHLSRSVKPLANTAF